MPSGKTGDKVLYVGVRKSAVEVYMESGEVFRMSPDTYSGFYLYKGKEVSRGELKEMAKAVKEEKAKNYALNYVTRGNRSKKETYEALVRKGNDKKTSYRLSQEMEELGLINEKDLAEQLIDQYASTGHGKAYIGRKLAEKGLPEQDVEIDAEALQNAFQALNRRYSRVPLFKRKAKVQDALLRRGYSHSEIEPLIASIGNTESQDEEDRESLVREGKRLISRLAQGYNWKSERPKIYAALIRKGYQSGDVLAFLEEMDETH